MIGVAGEALIDLVVGADGVIRALPGGGPFNTARALARLGIPTTFIGRLSSDAFGVVLRRQLEADGVAVAAGSCAQPTTLALASLDVGGTATYRFYSEGTSAFGLQVDDAGACAGELRALHVGSLGLVFEPMASALTALVSGVAGDALVVVDPNVRPAAIADAASYRTRLAEVLAHADLVKVSEDDLRWLDPARSPADAALALLGLGPRAVLLTRGDAGVVAVTSGGQVTVPAPPVAVVDTVGAGDAFTAGVLASWWEHGGDRAAIDDPEVLRAASELGVRVATHVCQRAGADPPWRHELG